MAGKWKARMGNLWGGFRVGSNKALPLVNPGEFKISDNGTIELSARYDPPGSGWRALVVAIVTGILVTIVAQATGFCAGPGWLLWCILIILIRRQWVSLNLENSESVVVDSANHRLGFLTDFQGEKRWVAFEIKENFDLLVQSITAVVPAPVAEGKIARRLRAATVAVLVTLAILVVMILLSILVVMRYRSTFRR